DDHTLRFTLDAPTPTFLETIADANLLFIQPTEADGGFDPRTVAIGSGPWILDAYDVSQRLRYRANTDYYVEGLPYLDAIERAIVPEYANRKAQFEAANTEAESIAADDIPEMARRFAELQWERPNTIGMA